MHLRFASRSFRSVLTGLGFAAALCDGGAVFSQDASGRYTDPATGIVYQRVERTIERPVVETQMRTQESTVYRPETVVSNRPENRTVYTPVVSYAWEPRLANRWNPFTQPTVVYQYVPRTHWEARSEVVNRQEIQTNYVAETRKVDVPQQIVRIQREQKTDYEPVGRVQMPQQATPPNSAEAAIAARLRPLDPNTQVQPFANQPVASVATANPWRNEHQQGMRANDLYPSQAPAYGSPLPPVSSGVAGLPLSPIWR